MCYYTCRLDNVFDIYKVLSLPNVCTQEKLRCMQYILTHTRVCWWLNSFLGTFHSVTFTLTISNAGPTPTITYLLIQHTKLVVLVLVPKS